MVDSSNYPKEILKSPGKIALAMTTALEASLDDGSTIPNAMNGMTIAWASACGVFASIVNMVDGEYATLYPKRALTPKQLYPHLSQYDYIQLQSAPATLDLTFRVRKDEIIANALPYDDVYNAIVIPKSSAFYIGPISVSMFYDIIIRVNKNTNLISVLYDTSETSPFQTLDTEMMAYPPVSYRQNMLDYIQFGFRTYQFVRTVYLETITSQEGFSYAFPFNNNFYAVRVFSIGAGGALTELAQCYDSRYYDTSTPTAIVSLDNQNNQVTVTIPQVYLENNQVSSQIRVEVYSTMGALTYNIPQGDAANVKADFDTKNVALAAPLERLASWYIYPLESTLTGGQSAKTFAQMKYGVVNQTFYNRIPITQIELNAMAENSGYKLTLQEDDITNRTYFATNAMYDSDGTLLPVLAGSILIEGDSLNGNPSTILLHSDQSIMILPTTIFELGATGSVCSPVTDENLTYLASLTKQDLVTEMNNTNYLRQPFHIALATTAVYPVARPYNLMAPTVTQLTYVKENETADQQMSITSIEIQHAADGTGGYILKCGAILTDSMKTVDPSALSLVMTLPTSTNTRAYLVGTVTDTTTAGNVIFTINLPTNYHIDVSDNITLEMTDWNGNATAAQVNLSSNAIFLLMIDAAAATTASQDNDILPNIPPPVKDGLCVSMQSAQVTLGTNMDKLIYSAVNTTWGNDVYKTYLADEYEKVTSPIYQRDANDQLVTRIITDSTGATSLDYVTLYSPGDLVITENDLTTTVSVAADSGMDHFTVADPTGILPGMLITCPGVTYGITVKSISGSVVTLSSKLTNDVPSDSNIIFTNRTKILTMPQDQDTADLTKLQVGNTSGIYVGQNVYGFDIPAGTTVTSVIDTQTISLSQATTKAVAKNTVVTFINKTGHAVCIHSAGDNVLDDLGNPIIIKDRQNVYRIPAILFDGRLYESQNVADQTLVQSLPTLLNDYAAGTKSINMDFAEQRDIYYQPARTIGTGIFDIGNNVTTSFSLSVGLDVTVFLPESLYGNTTIQTNIQKATLEQFTSVLGEDVISMFDLSSNLKTVLGNDVTGIAVSGLNGDSSLMITSLTDTNCKVSVRKILYVRDDGVVDRKPDINYTWKSSTDGT